MVMFKYFIMMNVAFIVAWVAKCATWIEFTHHNGVIVIFLCIRIRGVGYPFAQVALSPEQAKLTAQKLAALADGMGGTGRKYDLAQMNERMTH